MSRSTRRRFVCVDVLCSLAIALALINHAVNDFDVPARLPHDEFALFRKITRAAAPSFIFIFGMMLELLYARRLETRGMFAVAPRLFWHSLQCYAGCLVTVLAGLFDLVHALQATVLSLGHITTTF